ncbi:CvpA family protein [Aquimarina sp. W85]|uniref:CvpA family protein n=1 Tax=Aquimarina rhodophyticola TaxID=3342246 RepID=UPI003671DB73
MGYIDIILGILLTWGLIRGFSKGLIVSLTSLIALIAGIYIAIHFSHFVGSYLEHYVSWDTGVTQLLSFAITFLLVVLSVALLGKVLTKIANAIALGIINKLLGGAFGILKMAFIASVIIMLIDAGNNTFNFIDQDTLDNSILYKPVQAIAPAILPEIMKKASVTKETPKENLHSA